MCAITLACVLVCACHREWQVTTGVAVAVLFKQSQSVEEMTATTGHSNCALHFSLLSFINQFVFPDYFAGLLYCILWHILQLQHILERPALSQRQMSQDRHHIPPLHV